MENESKKSERIKGTQEKNCESGGSMWERVRRVSEKYPESTALSYFGKRVSYKALAKKVLSLRRGFETLGIGRGQVVMICLPNIPEAVYSLYALNSLGAVACFTHPLSSQAELKGYLESADAVAIVTLYSLKEKLESAIQGEKKPFIILTSGDCELSLFMKMCFSLSSALRRKKALKGEKLLPFSRLLKYGEALNTEERGEPSDTAVMLFSGGTTGKSKAVLLSNLNMNASASAMIRACGVKLWGKSILAAMPIFHGFGLCVGVHTPILGGASSILIPRIRNKSLAKIILKDKPCFLAGVPTFFETLRRNPYLKKADLSYLLGVFSGGDTLSLELREAFEEFLRSHNCSLEIREGYGCTECVAAVSLEPYKNTKKHSLGLALSSVTLKICEPDTSEKLKAYEVGEICVSGDVVMKGYLEDEEDRVLKVHSDERIWLHTGDLGYLDEEGYLYFSGRRKRVILSGGYNIYPEKLEEIFKSHPKVYDCCVVGVKDSYKMERPVAFVVAKGDIQREALIKSLRAFQLDKLSRFSLVRDFYVVESLPKTALGKVDILKLSEEINRAVP